MDNKIKSLLLNDTLVNTINTDSKNKSTTSHEHIIDLISFHKDNTTVMGAFDINNTTSQIDLIEKVSLSTNDLVKQFQAKIKTLITLSFIIIQDIKLGAYNKFKVIDETSFIDPKDNEIYRYDYYKSMLRLREVAPFLNKADYDEAKRLLKKNPNQLQLNKMNKMMRYHVVRWTPHEILRGYKVMPDNEKYTLQEAFKSDEQIFKMDVIALNDFKYVKYDIIYDLRDPTTALKHIKVPFNVPLYMSKDYKDNMLEGDFHKAIQRLYALLKYKHKFRHDDIALPVVVFLTKALKGKNYTHLNQMNLMLLVLINLVNEVYNNTVEKTKEHMEMMRLILHNMLSTTSNQHLIDIIDHFLAVVDGRTIGNLFKHIDFIHNTLTTQLNQHCEPLLLNIIPLLS